VFGPESQGLTSSELSLCHSWIAIPTAPGFSSLNLGQAVTVLLYEAMVAGYVMGEIDEPPFADVATTGDQERWLAKLGSRAGDPAQIVQLRHLLARAQPTAGDLALLHNLLKDCTRE